VFTADDFLAFARMLRNGGSPLLSRASVEAMTTDHLTTEQKDADAVMIDPSKAPVEYNFRRLPELEKAGMGWLGDQGSSEQPGLSCFLRIGVQVGDRVPR
jgi:hypothetical protein